MTLEISTEQKQQHLNGNQQQQLNKKTNTFNNESSETHERRRQLVLEYSKMEEKQAKLCQLLASNIYRKFDEENKIQKFCEPDELHIVFHSIVELEKVAQLIHAAVAKQLQERIQNWSTTPYFGDILLQYYKFYRVYKSILQRLQQSKDMLTELQKRPKFAAFMSKLLITEAPNFDNITRLDVHIDQIVSLPRRNLMLLKDYIKITDQITKEYDDVSEILNDFLEICAKTNDSIDKMAKFQDLYRLQLMFDPPIELINDSSIANNRELIKQGCIKKISKKSGEPLLRYMILLNDLLLICYIDRLTRKYKAKYQLNLNKITIIENSDASNELIFRIISLKQNEEFIAEDSKDKESWMQSFRKLTQIKFDTNMNKREIDSFALIGNVPPTWVKDNTQTYCLICKTVFSTLKRRHHCRTCGKIYCGSCCNLFMRVKFDNFQEKHRVCKVCYNLLKSSPSSQESSLIGIPTDSSTLQQQQSTESSSTTTTNDYETSNGVNNSNEGGSGGGGDENKEQLTKELKNFLNSKIKFKFMKSSKSNSNGNGKNDDSLTTKRSSGNDTSSTTNTTATDTTIEENNDFDANCSSNNNNNTTNTGSNENNHASDTDSLDSLNSEDEEDDGDDDEQQTNNTSNNNDNHSESSSSQTYEKQESVNVVDGTCNNNNNNDKAASNSRISLIKEAFLAKQQQQQQNQPVFASSASNYERIKKASLCSTSTVVSSDGNKLTISSNGVGCYRKRSLTHLTATLNLSGSSASSGNAGTGANTINVNDVLYSDSLLISKLNLNKMETNDEIESFNQDKCELRKLSTSVLHGTSIWERQFVVLTNDRTLSIYSNQNDYRQLQIPSNVIYLANFELVNVSETVFELKRKEKYNDISTSVMYTDTPVSTISSANNNVNGVGETLTTSDSNSRSKTKSVINTCLNLFEYTNYEFKFTNQDCKNKLFNLISDLVK